MENLAIKIKLAILWLFITGTSLTIGILTLMAPGVIDNIRDGTLLGAQIGSELLVIIAITYYLLPLSLAVCSIMLKGSLNRWINIIAGIGYIFFVLNELVSNVTSILYHFGILMEVSTIVVLALIVWNAWKWPKRAN
jgi:hypothetical protein